MKRGVRETERGDKTKELTMEGGKAAKEKKQRRRKYTQGNKLNGDATLTKWLAQANTHIPR